MAASSTTKTECENTGNSIEDFLHEFKNYDLFDDESSLVKRPTCDRCKRPKTVCWCPFLPNEPFQIRTNIYILQHPFEETRCLRTVPMLENSITADKCRIFIGKRFPNKSKHPELAEVFESPNTYLLYPGDDAMDIQDLPTSQDLNLVMLDGTWSQAKGMYCQNSAIRALKKVQIPMGQKSKYVIRTQPCDQSLSTLETAAIAVATLEQRPEIADMMTAPLVALCNFQLQHGALEHQSREYKVQHGLWNKPLSKSTRRKLEEYRLRCQNEL